MQKPRLRRTLGRYPFLGCLARAPSGQELRALAPPRLGALRRRLRRSQPLFSNDLTPLRTLRDFGLGLVERMPALKQLFVAEAAGLTGDVPKLLRGVPL